MKMGNAKFVSSLDATSGYWQIPMKESDRYKTAFVTDKGLYQWKVMCFGAKSAGNTFQRVMDDLLRPHSDYAHAYIDDTAVFSNDWKVHMKHLESVFQEFRRVGMTLKLSKCKFGYQRVKFIGHMVGNGERQPVSSKVDAIMQIAEPRTKKMLRSFLGMCNFYRTYIPKYSEIALPLTELTKSDRSNKVILGDTERAAFNKLKQALSEKTVLAIPDTSRPYIVRTDSSDYAIGATLSQDMDGVEKPIAFASYKFTDPQRKLSTIEKEAYAVIYALKKFDYLVFGREIVLYTDHDPLHYLTSSTPKSAKLTRWSLALTRYNIVVHHIRGRDNICADYLSRAHSI